MNNFVKRTLSGFLFVALIVGSILLSQYTFAVVFSLICGWAINEFHTITNNQPDVSVLKISASIAGILLFLSSFYYVSINKEVDVFLIYGLFIIIVLISELFLKRSNPIHNWAYFILGQLMVALPFALLNFIVYMNGYQPIILLAVFATIWVNDSGAY